MNWQHLTYFQEIAKLQNFTRAAENLYVTPSTLSKAISSLEDELGFPLFEKHGRNVTLTGYGKTFHRYVNVAVNDLDSGLSAVYKQMGMKSGLVQIAGIYTMCSGYLPELIKKFKSENADVRFSMEYMITGKIIRSVSANECDLGFCGDYSVSSEEFKDIEHVLIKMEDLVFALPYDHPLSELDSIPLEVISKEPFISYRNVNSGIGALYWPLFDSHGIVPRVEFEVSDDHVVLGLVAAGLGISLVPDSPPLRWEKVVFRRIKDLTVRRNLYMIWKKNRSLSEAAAAFRDMVLDNISYSDLVT